MSLWPPFYFWHASLNIRYKKLRVGMNDTFVFEQNREEFGEQINDICHLFCAHVDLFLVR